MSVEVTEGEKKIIQQCMLPSKTLDFLVALLLANYIARKEKSAVEPLPSFLLFVIRYNYSVLCSLVLESRVSRSNISSSVNVIYNIAERHINRDNKLLPSPF